MVKREFENYVRKDIHWPEQPWVCLIIDREKRTVYRNLSALPYAKSVRVYRRFPGVAACSSSELAA